MDGEPEVQEPFRYHGTWLYAVHNVLSTGNLVASDDEALALMNDSVYGLTASVWTSDIDRARHVGQRLETGTVFMNRCDYLDPELAWVGTKRSGRGCTLSSIGFEQLTRPKSFHFRRME